MEALYLLKNVYHDPLALQAEGGRADAEGTDLTLARPPVGRKTKCKLFWIFRRRAKRAFLFFCKTNRTALVRLVS